VAAKLIAAYPPAVPALWSRVQALGQHALGESVRSGVGALPRPLVAVAAMVVLAGLDLVGAVLAKNWSDRGSLISLLGGVAVFGLLFVVYGSSLAYAELATVTFGWVVILQIGVVLLQRVQDGVAIAPDRLGVMIAILALQGYLVLRPSIAD
jgi:uncharacterized membrane protein YdfJ with MMPL/SSD domain